MYKYVHGGDVYSLQKIETGIKIVDFSANVNPLGLPAGVKTALRKAVLTCSAYPDPFCRELTTAIAADLSVKAEQIFFGSGAADVLFRLMLALRPRRALIPAPTFADYEKALQTVFCKLDYYNLNPDDDFKIGTTILSHIKQGTDIVVLCNPNNPTGTLTDQATQLAILNRCREVGARLLIDECFLDFLEDEEAYSLKEFLNANNNLIILKAFTKTYAMAGVRLGYCLSGDEGVVRSLRENGQDWNVSALAQAAGIAAVKEKAYLEKTRLYVKAERKYLEEALRLLGAKTYRPAANYVFFFFEDQPDLDAKLLQEGFLIRDCSNYRNLKKGFYRIAVKTKKQNRLFIRALRKVLK